VILARALRTLSMLLALGVVCAAQEAQPTPEPEEFPTKLEELLEKAGAVVVKGTTAVGSVSGLRGAAFVTSWEILDARSGRREYGISIEIRESAQAERERERGDVAYVDYDELDPLLNGLDQLLKLDNTATKLSTFEAQYRTNGYLSVFRFNTTGGYGTAVSAGGRRGARLILRPTGLVEFRDMLKSAKAVIDEARQKP
jgi:hypothetical protein